VPEVPIHNIHWKGKQMNPSTKDEIKGKFHEVKGEVKEKVGQVTNTLPARLRKRSGRLKKCSRSNSGELCPEQVSVFETGSRGAIVMRIQYS
jgi:hypothetical protein